MSGKKRKREEGESPQLGTDALASSTQSLSNKTLTVLPADKASQLVEILVMLDSDLLNHKVANAAFPSLKRALESKPTHTFAALRAFVPQLCANFLDNHTKTLPPASNKSKPLVEDAVDLLKKQTTDRTQMRQEREAKAVYLQAWQRQFDALLDELQHGLDSADRHSRGKRGSLPPIKLEDSNDKLPDQPKLVALHRIAGGSHDLFSSASSRRFDEAAINALSKLEDADIVELDEMRGYTQYRVDGNTLGEVSLPPEPPMPRLKGLGEVEKLEPVTFLYYDPFSSFAPTHDSARAQLNYRDSVLQWQRLRQAAEFQLPRQNASASPMLDQQDFAQNGDGQKWAVDESLATSVGIPLDRLKKTLESLPSDDSASPAYQMLKHNNKVISELQKKQHERLWLSAHTTSEAIDNADSDEITAANELLDSLASAVDLANLKPRDLIDKSAVPKAERALKAPRFAFTSDLPTNVAGTLDPNNPVAVLLSK